MSSNNYAGMKKKKLLWQYSRQYSSYQEKIANRSEVHTIWQQEDWAVFRKIWYYYLYSAIYANGSL